MDYFSVVGDSLFNLVSEFYNIFRLSLYGVYMVKCVINICLVIVVKFFSL